MSGFVDATLLQVSQPAGLTALLAPSGAPTPQRLTLLAEAVYGLEGARIDSLTGVTVGEIVLQRPLFAVHRLAGTWTGVVPTYGRSDLALERTGAVSPQWVDALATVRLRAIVELDAGVVESVRTAEIEGFTTLDEFRDRFRFLDLDDFMARHRLSTVEELRDAYRYLLTEIRLRAPPVFDAGDPANLYDVEVPLALLIRDQLDLTAALRDAKLLRALARDAVAVPAPKALGEVLHPWAVAVVFPRASLVPAGPSEAAVHQLFAHEQVLSLFSPT